jgi:hypothetical protein
MTEMHKLPFSNFRMRHLPECCARCASFHSAGTTHKWLCRKSERRSDGDYAWFYVIEFNPWLCVCDAFEELKDSEK